MAAVAYSFALKGIEGQLVEVEAETMLGLSNVSIVGLGDKAVKEARERLEAAIIQAGFVFPLEKVVFNLAPSDIKKTGTHYDLAMAVALLLRSNQIKTTINLQKTAFIGELSLNANIRPSSGVLPMAIHAKELGLERLIVPYKNVIEARLVEGIDVIGCRTLKETIEFLIGKEELDPVYEIESSPSGGICLDFAEVCGQESLIEFILIAAAGGHNILMMGPPGCGKSMIAKRIPTILPPMNEQESLEVTKIYSVADKLTNKGSLIKNRPFRAPHHNASTNSLIGGGPFAKPGEISLAHHGILFLDEMAEFSRKTLDSLRQPLEDQRVTISRVWGGNTYPANFMLVGAMNPCLCGYYGQKRCRCTDYEVSKYRGRVSGPLLDRLDIQKYVRQVDLFGELSVGKTSKELRQMVEKARQLQHERYKNVSGVYTNAQVTTSQLKELLPLDTETTSLLKKAYERFQYSGRSLHKFIKIARTIADLEGERQIRAPHMVKSLQSRDLEKEARHLQGDYHA